MEELRMPTLAALPIVAFRDTPTTLADLLLRAANQHAACGVHFAAEDRTDNADYISYAGLLEASRRICAGLQERAIRPDSKITLLLDRPRDFIPAFWACVLGGYVPCPLAPIRNDDDRWAKHLTHVDSLLDRPLFVSTGALLEALPAAVISADLQDLRAANARERIHRARPSDPAILMLTSGSTGNSKAVELTHGNLIASLAGREERQQLTSADRMFNWIAFDHVAALLESHMIALYAGANQLQAEPAQVLTDPLQFLRLIHRHRVTVAFAPNFLLGQINAALQASSDSSAQRLDVDLSRLRRIITGGEANVVETGRRFLEMLAPYGLARNALWPAFGMTETCAASVYSHEFPDLDAKREFAAVGLPIRGMNIRIVDEKGGTLPGGEIGELQLSGPLIFHRYYNNEEATRAAFTEDGWFRTGDLGRLDDGRLNLVARTKDSIIVSGVNYFSHELETHLEQLEGIERSYVAAFPTRPKGADTEQLVVAFATTVPAEDEDTLYQLLVAVRNTAIMLWGFRPAKILVLPKSVFPKTSLGKIQRTLMRKRFEAGEFSPYSELVAQITTRQIGSFAEPEGPVEKGVTEMFSGILGMELATVSAAASFFDLGGTSLDILKLTQLLERRFGLNGGLPLVLQNPSVRQLATRIESGAQPAVAYDPIVPLQATGKKTPLFCVHPGNGEIFIMTNLAKYFLNDRPFYALRPRGFNEGEDVFRSVDEIVDTYVDAITRRQPHGPYAIAGYSLGVRIAFEIVKRLEARGERVAFHGIIDLYPGLESTPVDFVTIALGLAFVTDLIDKKTRLELGEKIYTIPREQDPCEYILQHASPERLMQLGIDLRKFSTWARVAFSLEDLLLTHLTSGTVSKITVFVSNGIDYYTTVEWTKDKWREQLEHWSGFTPQPKYIDVPGNHHTVMSPKNVAAFQAILRHEIDAALSEQ
jgi:acyl-CoA synthetase (AMP-forming)/AMP-acid ligase II/thioesterase domain-containing protein/acyl carrier protein